MTRDEEKAEFYEFLQAFPPPVQEFLNEPETKAAMERAAIQLRQNHEHNGVGGSSDFNEGMIEGLKCGMVVFFDMVTEFRSPAVVEACLMGGIVSSVAFIEMCYRMLEEGENDGTSELDGA